MLVLIADELPDICIEILKRAGVEVLKRPGIKAEELKNIISSKPSFSFQQNSLH